MTVRARTDPIVVNNTFVVETIKGHFHGLNRFDAVLERSDRYVFPISCVQCIRGKWCRCEFHASNGGGASCRGIPVYRVDDRSGHQTRTPSHLHILPLFVVAKVTIVKIVVVRDELLALVTVTSVVDLEQTALVVLERHMISDHMSSNPLGNKFFVLLNFVRIRFGPECNELVHSTARCLVLEQSGDLLSRTDVARVSDGEIRDVHPFEERGVVHQVCTGRVQTVIGRDARSPKYFVRYNSHNRPTCVCVYVCVATRERWTGSPCKTPSASVLLNAKRIGNSNKKR